jgi:hypothetical protein
MAASNTQTVVTVVMLLLVVLVLAYSIDPTFGGLLRVKQGFEGMPNVPVSTGDMPPGLMNNSGNANRNRNVDNQIAAQGLFKNGKKVGMWKMLVKGKLKDVNMNYQNIKFKKPEMPNQADVKVEVKDVEKPNPDIDNEIKRKLGR